jgi:hypothetical protein
MPNIMQNKLLNVGDFKMESEIRPNRSEIEFLTLAYNRFYDIFEEITDDIFWDKEPYYRFSKLKDAFSVYAELLNYDPIKWMIEEIKEKRPPMEGVIGSELFKFIRNVFSHFPFFNCWDDVWINRSIVNWNKEGQSIDKFLKKYCGKNQVKYRYWEPSKKKMTYLDISFPSSYTEENKVYLKDILTEKEGAIFSLILMKKVLDTQVNNC